MKPLGSYLIVEPAVEEVTKTDGGLLLTEKQGEVRYRKATVLEVANGMEEILKCCDTIYYDKHAGQTLDVDGTDYTVIQLRDVVVVL